MIYYRFRRHFFPSPVSMTLLWGGLAYSVMDSICTIFTAFSTTNLKTVPLVLVISALSPLALISAVLAFFIEKQSGPRSSLWIITTVVISIATMVMMIFPIPGQTIREGMILSLLCCGPFLIISALLSLYFIIRAYPSFELNLVQDRAYRFREILMARSEISINDLSVELEMQPATVPQFVDKLVKSGFVSAYYSSETGLIYTLAALLEKQRRLTSIIEVRGHQTLNDLAQGLHVPQIFIRNWLQNITEKGMFSGFVDPKTNEIISAQINSVALTPNCPNCGGLLGVVGKGINQCKYCGAEIFLSQYEQGIQKENKSHSYEYQVKTETLSSKQIENKRLESNLPGIWKVIRPQFFSRLVVGIISFVLILGSLCSISILSTEPLQKGGPLALAALGLFFIPLVVLILIFAALREKNDPPRFFLWSFTMAGMGLSIAAVAVAMWVDQTAGPDLSITSMVYFAGPLLSIFSIPVVYYGIRSWPAIIQELSTNLTNTAIRLINNQGETHFHQIAKLLDIPISQVDNLLDELLQNGKISGAMNTRHQRIYTTSALAEKHTSLLILVRDKGEISMEDLAQKLDTPLEILQEWIYQLVQMDRFTGYINWNEQKLYAAHAFELSEARVCPACGGKLNPGSEKTIHCKYCGTDIILSHTNLDS